MSSIDDFLAFKAIRKDNEPLNLGDAKKGYEVLHKARVEIKEYIESLMGSDYYLFEMHLPAGTLLIDKLNRNCIKSDSQVEMVYLPYMNGSSNIIQALKHEGSDSPVYRVAAYLHDCVAELRDLVTIQGVSPESLITIDMLNEYRIMDIFSIHSFEFIYRYF